MDPGCALPGVSTANSSTKAGTPKNLDFQRYGVSFEENRPVESESKFSEYFLEFTMHLAWWACIGRYFFFFLFFFLFC